MSSVRPPRSSSRAHSVRLRHNSWRAINPQCDPLVSCLGRVANALCEYSKVEFAVLVRPRQGWSDEYVGSHDIHRSHLVSNIDGRGRKEFRLKTSDEILTEVGANFLFVASPVQRRACND